MKKFLYPADILLPDFNVTDGTKWACVACDQYTSEPEYWEKVEELVGGAPSTLRLMLPEARLEKASAEVPAIHKTMKDYIDSGVLCEHKRCGIYVERTQADGRVRRGLVACIDLEDYDYSAGSVSPVRATEKTVAERIPPRLAVRRGAPLEMPHVLLLIDDPENKVLGRFACDRSNAAYDFELMQGGGAVKAAYVSGEVFTDINYDLISLSEGRENPIVLAVGDGNHSLATAKAAYEEIKHRVGRVASKVHPARYALVEIENIYDAALDFEPIYRVVKSSDNAKLVEDFKTYLKDNTAGCGTQSFDIISDSGRETVKTDAAPYSLSVTTLQRFLDAWAEKNGGLETDYIHGDDTLVRLAQREGYIGFLFEGMRKDELFRSVERDGSLPRKTFSMGHACDKRFYIECRRIKK